MEKIAAYIQQFKQEKNLVIVGHEDADTDALGACYALAELLGGEIYIPNKIAESALDLVEDLKMKINFGPCNLENHHVIIVDTADSQQLPNITFDRFLIIDHHRNNLLVEKALASYYKIADSTCGLVYELICYLNLEINETIAKALAAGILGDTIYLEKASGDTLIILGNILNRAQINLQVVMNMMKKSRKLSRAAKLTAALNANLYYIEGNLVILAKTESNFMYYIAMMFLELGADVALIYHQENNNIHLRLVKRPNLENDFLDLKEIVKKGIKGKEVENFWGDEKFVGFKGQGDECELLKDILKNIASS